VLVNERIVVTAGLTGWLNASSKPSQTEQRVLNVVWAHDAAVASDAVVVDYAVYQHRPGTLQCAVRMGTAAWAQFNASRAMTVADVAHALAVKARSNWAAYVESIFETDANGYHPYGRAPDESAVTTRLALEWVR
jgi:hypothetical protein